MVLAGPLHDRQPLRQPLPRWEGSSSYKKRIHRLVSLRFFFLLGICIVLEFISGSFISISCQSLHCLFQGPPRRTSLHPIPPLRPTTTTRIHPNIVVFPVRIALVIILTITLSILIIPPGTHRRKIRCPPPTPPPISVVHRIDVVAPSWD